jgi:primosomal protein N' (replication factor Y)
MEAILEALTSHPRNTPPSEGGKALQMELQELLQQSGASKQTLQRLQEKGLVELKTVPVEPQEYQSSYDFPSLSDEQKNAFQQLQKSSRSLLFAPTGSGKSHLLRMLADGILRQKKTALFVVPEIGLTQELVQKCNEVFGEEHVALYHSRLAEGEKARVFWKVKTGVAKVVIGSRASLFLPFQDLGLIALEEEHEWTLKSDQSPRYHAKDVCLYLSEIHTAQLVFSSATPSLESIANDELRIPNDKTQKQGTGDKEQGTGNKEQELRIMDYESRREPDNSQFSILNSQVASHDFRLITLPARTPLPQISLVDLKEESLAKNPTLLSHALQLQMQKTLEKKQQVLLFLNRRGFHRTLLCQDCGEIVRCPECATSLVLHQGKEKEFLLCHYCGKVFGVPEKCSHCGSVRIGYLGSGTAKIEKMVQTLFPEKKVVRIDRDTTSQKSGFSDLYSDVLSGEADILIGTQIIAKGLDFENIGLVGILDADAGLHIPDFRSAERTFQLLTQVIGRAGRRGQSSNVILQTRLPHHPLFVHLKKGDTEGFYAEELRIREEFFLPPFSRIIKLIFVGVKKETVFQRARETQQILMSVAKDRFPGERVDVSVAPSLHPKKHGKYHVNVLLVAKDPESILFKTPIKGCRIDNDPVEVVG